MLRSTLRKLAKGWRATPRRSPRASTRRPMLEALEDRLVLSTAQLFGSVLAVEASPGFALPRPRGGSLTVPEHILLKADAQNHGLLDVTDTTANAFLGQFPITSINSVDLAVQGLDALDVDDSNGFPFAPGTNIIVGGQVAVPPPQNNSFNLFGSRPIDVDETYTADNGILNGSLRLDFTVGSVTTPVTFEVSPFIASVTDALPNTGFDVIAPGHAVTLSGQDGHTEQLSGLADIVTVGGGGLGGPGFGGPSIRGATTLAFANKGEVALHLTNNATATLGATKADPALRGLRVDLGPSDTLNINATPNTVSTLVDGGAGSLDRINLAGNSGAVKVVADPTSTVKLGSNFFFAQSVTSGINANVTVTGGHLEIADAGNTATQEQVTVTESTISGKGLFGNSGVVLSYQQLRSLLIFTGRLANTYTVAPSHPGASFSTGITIDDFASSAGLSVTVNVDADSGLNLHLINPNHATGHLTIAAATTVGVGARFNPQAPATPNGTETVSFFLRPRGRSVGLSSVVSWTGFDSVGLEP